MSKLSIKIILMCLITLLLVLGFVGVVYKLYIKSDGIIPDNNKENNLIIEENDGVDNSIAEEVTVETSSDSVMDDGEYLYTNFKNKIYYFNQRDYANEKHGTYGTIKGYGCGPTTMAMVLSSFMNKRITPVEATNWACSHNYCSEQGTNNRFFFAMGKEYNLKVEGPFESDKEENRSMVYEALGKSDTLVILSVGNGDFYKGGHYMLLAGLDGDAVVVADPNSREKSKAYSYEYLMSKNANPQNFYIISENKEGE